MASSGSPKRVNFHPTDVDNHHDHGTSDLIIKQTKVFEDLRSDLEDRMDFLKRINLSGPRQNRDELESLRVELRKAREVLTGTDRYLKGDFQPAIFGLKDSLKRNSALIHKKLKQEPIDLSDENPKSKHELERLREVAADQEALARIAVEMKELEELSTRMSNRVERLNAALEAADHDTRGMEDDLNKEEDEAERIRREQILRVEEEQRRRQETEELEKKRIKDEERRRREEEEERLKRIEEERLKKEDPRNWPNVMIFEADEENDGLGSGVALVLRAQENVSIIKTQFYCKNEDFISNVYPLAEFEELVSNRVHLKPAAGRDIEFESAVWLAIPYAAAPRTRETVIKLQRVASTPKPGTPMEKVDDEKRTDEEAEEKGGKTQEEEPPSWEDTLTRDTTVEGHEHFRFVETYLRHLPADGINIVVLTRFKRDHQTFNNKGGKLVSSLDHRVSIVCPKNGFRLTTDMTMQTIPLDTTALTGLKERFDGCEQLLGMSPIVRLTSTSKPNKPLNYFVTQPIGGNKAKKTGSGKEGEGGEKDIALPRATKANSAQDEENEVDFIFLLTKESVGRAWRAREDVTFEFQKDVVGFQLPNVVERFILLRTSSRLDPPELVRMATNLETSIREKSVAVIVRQHYHDLSRLILDCCKRESVDRIVQKLKDEQFSEGQHPVIVSLREGDIIDIRFNTKGNVDFLDHRPRQVVFYSNLSTCKMLAEVKEVDVFAQNALDHFRGNIRLRLQERSCDAATKFQTNFQNSAKGGAEPGLLCEPIVALPKPRKRLAQVTKIRLPIKPDGPLTEEYFNQLSTDLGDEWFQVASNLKISKASIQRITTSHANLDGVEATQRSIQDMLREWFLSSTKSRDKVDDLRVALLNAGRNDLAEELVTKKRELRKEIERRQEEDNLKKCIQAFCSSQAAVKAWRSVAKALGLREDEIVRIAGDQKEATNEICSAMLRRWKEIRGREATKEILIITLKKLKLNEAAGKVSLIR